MELKLTKIVNELPSTLEANTEYLVPNPNGKYDTYQTDNNKVIKKLNTDIPENLLRRSTKFNTLNNSNSNAGGYVTNRLWDSIPVLYGMWQNGEWGFSTRSVSLLNKMGGYATKDIANKKITVSVDVRIAELTGYNFQDTGGIEIGLGYGTNDERPYTLYKSDGWVRIKRTIQGDRLPGICAKFKNPSAVTGTHNHLTCAINYQNWKISEVEDDDFFVPCWSDFGDLEVYYSSTVYLSTPNNFNTETLIGGQVQDGLVVGLTNQNTTITITGYRQVYKTTYKIIRDNTTVTFVTSTILGTTLFSNSKESDPKVFRGNTGDEIVLERILDTSNRTVDILTFKPFNDNLDSYVIPITSNITLDKTHIGRTLQFNNTSNINVNITDLPAGAMISGIKNTGAGTVTITGTTAPTTDNVLNNVVNSSFSLVKNADGVSNLLMSNK